MAYIPENAKWYLADLIVEISIDAEPSSLIHINTILVRADSPEEAHEKALELGQQEDQTYVNTDGKLVSSVFRGLRDLNVIHDELEHGAELMYRERVGLSAEQIGALVTPKVKLGVFAARVPSAGPNFMPKSVMDGLRNAGFGESDITNGTV
jgi:hypothetical protein